MKPIPLKQSRHHYLGLKLPDHIWTKAEMWVDYAVASQLDIPVSKKTFNYNIKRLLRSHQ